MDLEVRHLKLIAAVADYGGLTQAGHRLHLTQSALSHQLRDIEDKLGLRLFLRMRKKMPLTPAGERLLRSARLVLDELRRAEEDLRQTASGREGVLRLSTECNTCYHWLPSRLRLFHQKFPGVEVQVVAEATLRPIEFLLDGRLDLAIVHNPVRDRRVVTRPLFRDEVVVIMPPDHPLARRPFIRAEDFAGQNLICYAIRREENLIFRKILFPAGVTPRQVTPVQLTEAIIEMVRAGLGISTMARWAVAPELESGRLKGVPLTGNGFHRVWSVAMMRAKPIPAYLLEFARLLPHAAPARKRFDPVERMAAGA